MTRKLIVAGSATCGKTLMLEQRAELLKKQGKKVKIMRADDLNNKKSDMKELKILDHPIFL